MVSANKSLLRTPVASAVDGLGRFVGAAELVVSQEAMRFVLHLFLVCVVAPAAAISTGMLCGVWETKTVWPDRVLEAIFGGIVLLPFSWPIIVPIGVISYALFAALSQRVVESRAVWCGIGGFAGAVCAVFMQSGGWFIGLLIIGAAVGTLTGAILRDFWIEDHAKDG